MTKLTRTDIITREAESIGFRAPRVISVAGHIFENAKGGPYKYGNPLPATRQNLRFAEVGIL